MHKRAHIRSMRMLLTSKPRRTISSFPRNSPIRIPSYECESPRRSRPVPPAGPPPLLGGPPPSLAARAPPLPVVSEAAIDVHHHGRVQATRATVRGLHPVAQRRRRPYVLVFVHVQPLEKRGSTLHVRAMAVAVLQRRSHRGGGTRSRGGGPISTFMLVLMRLSSGFGGKLRARLSSGVPSA